VSTWFSSKGLAITFVELAVALHKKKSTGYWRLLFFWSAVLGFDEKLRIEIITMASRLAISYLIFSQYSKVSVTYQ
jgi:hypothetical protein